MGAVTTKTIADLRRRRLQSFALALVLFLAAATATLALDVLVASHDPFDRAFDAAAGAHLVVEYDPAVPDDRLAATAHAQGVTAAAGPWPVVHGSLEHPKGGLILGQVFSARPTPASDAAIDRVVIDDGRWWAGPGEVVLDADTARILMKSVGSSVTLHTAPAGDKSAGPSGGGARPVVPDAGASAAAAGASAGAAVTLTVVGIAESVSTPDVAAWLSPGDLATLAGPASSSSTSAKEMLYRVDPSGTDADLAAAMSRISRDLPSTAVIDRASYLDQRTSVDRTADLYVPVLLAFSVFALLAAAFSIGNLVSGTVLTGYRDIGVMKAVGYTPAQVTTTLLGQILVPAAVGGVLGVVVGAAASLPIITQTTESFGLPATVTVFPLVLLTVLFVALGVAVVAALLPAVRAGRLDPVDAITRGTMPPARGIGARLRRLGFGVPASLSVRLGLTSGLAHPGRAAMTLGALIVGVAAVTFSVGMNVSLLRIMDQLQRNQASPVRAEIGGLGNPVDPAAISATIAGLPETGRSVGLGQIDATVSGAGAVPYIGYDGDASWIGYALIHGRWLAGPGEVVATTNLFRRTGAHLGDTIEISAGGRSIQVVLVGEVFDLAKESPDNLVLRGSWADVLRLDPTASIDRWEMQPRSDVSPHDYRSAVMDATGRTVPVSTISDSTSDADFLLFLSVVAALGIVLVVMSIGGVFNTVLLETRHRTRELAILKAIGLTPRSTIAMIEATVLPVAIAAGLIGVPIGLAIQRAVLGYMGETAARTAIPELSFDVFGPVALIGLALTGLAIATVGAFVPAQRAARARIAPVLQAE
jgi:putative ABC transport system permease protein